MIVIGGLGSIHGAFLGAAVVTFLPLMLIGDVRDLDRRLVRRNLGHLAWHRTRRVRAILIGFILFEPRGIYGRWLKIRTYFELFPFYRRDMFKRQKSYLKTERMR
jgi:branched-chain amino acid transport system permease protein